jgi:hypothetical protein
MRIKVGNEYLDFNDSIEIERQAKLFQDISGIFGDYSYSFSIPKTDRNIDILDLKSINQRMTVGVKRDCILYTDANEQLYSGFIRIESIGEAIECSFFTGNNSWFEATRKRISEYNFNRLIKEFNYANVVASWTQKSGIVWPLVDRGTLHKRNTPTLYDNDLQPFIYVKDAINEILGQSGGIKLAGDILKDPTYNTMITTNNGLFGIQDRIARQEAYIGKGANQTVNSTTFATLTFTDTTDPYSPSDYYTSSVYTIPEGWSVGKVEYKLDINPVLSFFNVSVRIAINDIAVTTTNYSTRTISDVITVNNLSSGSTIKIQVAKPSSISGVSDFDVLDTSFVKISPIKFLNVYPQQLLPNLDANEFIANVFTQLNIFSAYDATRKVIETRVLENIKNAPEIDISEYVSRVTQNGFTELVADYGKSSRFMYIESGDEYTEEYNSINPIFYGGGEVVIDNDFIEEKVDFAELDFVAPWQIPVEWLGFALPLLEMNEFVIESSQSYSGVQAVSGPTFVARFRWLSVLTENTYSVGDLVKITDSGTSTTYNGIYRVTAVGSDSLYDYLEVGILYEDDSQGLIEKVRIDDILNEDQITICNVPNTDTSDFTTLPEIAIVNNGSVNFTDNIALGYFWLPQVNKPINRIRQSLSFGDVNDPQWYQQNLIETYYNISNQVLNNPVMVTVEAFIPEKVFKDMDFLRPLRLRTAEFNSQFILNRVTGYQGSHLPCELELVQLTNTEVITNIQDVAPAPPPPDPEPDLYNYYLCSISECGECFFFRDRIVQSLDVLTVGKYYEAEYITDSGMKVVVLVLSESSGFPLYRVTDSTQYDTCEEIIC